MAETGGPPPPGSSQPILEAGHHLQKAYLEVVSTALDLLDAANMEGGPQRFAGFGHIVGDLARTERTLPRRYDVLLGLLGEPAGASGGETR